MPHHARTDAQRGRQMAGLIRPPSRTSSRSHLPFPGEISEHARQLGTQPAVRLPPVETVSSPQKTRFYVQPELQKVSPNVLEARVAKPCLQVKIPVHPRLRATEGVS